MSNPKITVYGISGTSIVRILFDRPMKNNDALLNVSNYTITPNDLSVSVPVIYKIILPENKTNPTYIDIFCTEMTINKTYDLQVNTSAGGPVDYEDNLIDPATGTKQFLGTGKAPTIKMIEATASNQVKITFTEVMDSNLDIRNKNKYTFDNGLTVLSVVSVIGSEVVLETSEQTSGILYKLTMSLT
jgi:hypothetical protein